MAWLLRNESKVLKALLQKKIRKSFHKSVLGVFWHMLIPAVQLFIFFKVYGAINAGTDIMASIIGLFVWLLFNNAIFPSIQELIGSKSLIINLKVSPYLIPASGVLMSILFTSLFLLSACAFIAIYGSNIQSGLILGIPIILLLLIFTYSIAVIVSLSNVYFRDIGMLWNSFSFLLFITAPILYPINILPNVLSNIAIANPITQFIIAMRTCSENSVMTAVSGINWATLIIITLSSATIALWINHLAKKDIVANL